MKTIEIKNAKDLNEYKSSNQISHLRFDNWSDGDIDLRGTKTGNIYLQYTNTGYIDLREARTGYIDLTGVTTGDINLRGAKTGDIYSFSATTGQIKQNYTTDDISFLKSLPLGVIDLLTCQSNENWKECKTIDELHTCGTTYCIRGYAESKYFIKNGKECEDVDTLYPNLKHLFYMSNKQFKEELQNILG